MPAVVLWGKRRVCNGQGDTFVEPLQGAAVLAAVAPYEFVGGQPDIHPGFVLADGGTDEFGLGDDVVVEEVVEAGVGAEYARKHPAVFMLVEGEQGGTAVSGDCVGVKGLVGQAAADA